MNKIQRIMTIMTITSALSITGCRTSSRLAIDPMPDSLKYTQVLTFNEDIDVPQNAAVQDANDPKQVILFALALSRRGRHGNAARFFVEAAQRFRSLNRELEISLYAAAANEYLKAGDMMKFRETIQGLRQTATRFQYAGFDQNTAALISLGDIAAGETVPNELTPPALRDLYKIKTSR